MSKKAEYEKKILDALKGHGAYTTGGVASRIYLMLGANMRQHSSNVRQLLLGLEKTGLVKRLDKEKPVCWLLTEADGHDQ